MELTQILKERLLTPLFQPIVDCRQRSIIGHEALIRGPSDSLLHSPIQLFDAASRNGRLFDLDLLAREICIKRFAELNVPGKLFVNVTPDTIMEPGFQGGLTLQFLEQTRLSPDRIVIELTEQYPINNYELMREAMLHYRSMGFAIAIDDLGTGYSSLRHWSELNPDFVKIDKHFVQNLNEDPGKRQFIRSILEIAHGLGCKVIAEGIETVDEYHTLCNMGLELGQGYYFARPGTTPLHKLSKQVTDQAPCQGQYAPALGNTHTVASLIHKSPPVEPGMPLSEVAALFHREPSQRSVAVVRHEQPIGLVHRQELMHIVTSPYGMSLHGKKAISAFMRTDTLIVNQGMSVEQLSQRITGANELNGDEDFIITDDDGYYAGIGTVLSLLKKITDLQILHARYANPLTQLPGNVPINEHLQQLLDNNEAFTVVYCDLDNFKAYNDTYGYARGDEVITETAKLLIRSLDPGCDFLGHVGGDDFIIVFRSPDWRTRCDDLLGRFQNMARQFYDEEHRLLGGIQSVDRRGLPVFYDLASLSLGAVPVTVGSAYSPHDISSKANQVKKRAKAISGNSLFIERRHGDTEQAVMHPQPLEDLASVMNA